MDGMYAGFAGAKTGHGRPALIWRLALPTDFLLSFAPPCWCDLDPVFAVRCEYAVEAREIDPRFRHQRGQLRDKIQRIEYHMGRAIIVRVL